MKKTCATCHWEDGAVCLMKPQARQSERLRRCGDWHERNAGIQRRRGKPIRALAERWYRHAQQLREAKRLRRKTREGSE